MGTKQFSNYDDLLTFTRASGGHALRPVSYGDELVTNGTFDSDTTGATPATWETNNANASLVKQADGTALFSSTSFAYARVQAASRPVLSVGLYRVSFEISEWSGSLSAVHVGLNAIGNIVSGSGTYSYIYTSTAEQAYEFQIRPNGGGTGSFKIDNISVKEVLFDQPDGTLTLFEHPNNIPRVEYDADGNRLGLLVEEARTNSLLKSNEVTNAPWTFTTTATQNLTGPDGVSNSGWTLEDTSESTFQQNTQTVAITANTNTHCVSFFIKKDNDESRFPEFQIVMGGNFFVQVNTKTGVTYSRTNQISGTSDVEDYGEWWRIVMTVTNGGAATSLLFKAIPAVSTALGNTVSATITGSIGFYGAQFEGNASFPTSYIKTTGSTATRSADVASIPVADFGYNQSAGTLFAEYSYLALENNQRSFQLGTSSGTDFVMHYTNSNNTRFYVVDDSLAQANLVVESSSSAGVINKLAGAFKENDFAGSQNGGAIETDSSGTVPSADYLYVGRNNSGGSQLNGHIKSIKYYPRRLSNAQLQEITS